MTDGAWAKRILRVDAGSCRWLRLPLPALVLVFCGACGRPADSPEVILERGRILSERRQFEEAIPLFSQALETFPERAEIYYLRGVAYENVRLPERALADYSKAVELEPDRHEAINNKGVALAKLDRFEDAVAEFSRLIELRPDDALAFRNRGLSQHDLGRLEEALADYGHAIRIAPGDPLSWFQRGNVYLEQGQLPLAEQDFSKAIELDPLLARGWMNRGIARYLAGQKELAWQDLENSQDLDENIVLPGLNYFLDAPAAGQVPAADSAASHWPDWREAAEQELQRRGFTALQLKGEFPEFRCAEYLAEFHEQPRAVYLSFTGPRAAGPNSQPGAVILPGAAAGSGQQMVGSLSGPGARTDSDAPQAASLLILQPPEAPGSAISVVLFQEQWEAVPERIRPVLIQWDPTDP